MKKIVIIGGGASGMAAAVFAAREGISVSLFEKNESLGRKLFITGKGRCNFTNVCSTEELRRNVVSNPRFLYSAFEAFDARQAVAFFEELGVKTKVERGRRAFPASDHSSDIIRALEKAMRIEGVKIFLNTRVKELILEPDGSSKADEAVNCEARQQKKKAGKEPKARQRAAGVVLEDGSRIFADAVIVAAGGLSYPSTGACADGYHLALSAGIPVTATRPALVPLEAEEEDVKALQGLSLKNVEFTVKDGRKKLFGDFGELLFTHFGVSGPLAISASSVIAGQLEAGPLTGVIDLKPALSEEQLDARVLREFADGKNRQFKNAVAPLFPAKLLPVMVARSGIPADQPVNSITKGQRSEFVSKIKHFAFTITGTRGYPEAVITQGGVNVRRIDPGSMEAKSVSGLYFIGEVLDVDAFTGGYNLQIAWSTAFQAVKGIGQEVRIL